MLLLIVALVFLLETRPHCAFAQDGTEPTTAVLDSHKPMDAQTLRDAAKAEMNRIPEGTAQESPEGRLKAALDRRLVLLDELQTLRDSETQRAELQSRLSTRTTAANESLKGLDIAAAAEVPTNPDQAAYRVLEQTLSKAMDDLAARRAAQVEQQRRVDVELPQLILEAQARSQEAIKRRNRLQSTTAELTNPVEQRTLDILIENAGFDSAVAQQTEKQLKTELSLSANMEQV